MNEWMNNPILNNIDPIKLELIKTAAAQTSGKSGKDLPPVLLTLIMDASKKGIQFSPEEMGIILDLLKEGKSKKEQEQIDKTVKMASSLMQSRKPKS
ncbi:hypothetical protein ACTQ6A_02185 [Lachnospiraceae bacterium LCP25S3_G4]